MKIINQDRLDEVRHTLFCEMCGRYSRKPLEPHHILCRGIGGGNRLDLWWNTVGLCGAFDGGCHAKAQANIQGYTKADMFAIVANRPITGERIEEELRVILRS